MAKAINTFTLTEKALLRLQLWDRIERSQIMFLQKHGLVTIDKKYFPLDDGGFDYPFGDAGTAYLEYIEFTRKGHDSYVTIFNTRLGDYKSWKEERNNISPNMGAEQILCTQDHIKCMINIGLRDQLVVSNRRTGHEEHYAELYENGEEYLV